MMRMRSARIGRACASRTRKGGRAFVLLDMLLTLILVGVLMTIVVQLIGALLRTGRELADTGRQSAVIDRAVTLLRRDVLQAQHLRPIADGCDTGVATWHVDTDTLVRKTSTGEERFGPLIKPPQVAVTPDVVQLQLGDDKWALRRLTLEGR